MQHIFSYTYLPSVYLLGEVSVKAFGPFFKIELLVFLLLNFKSFSCILGNSPLSDMFSANIFFQVCGLSFHFLDQVGFF